MVHRSDFKVAIAFRNPLFRLPSLCLATTKSPSPAHLLFPSRLLDPNLAGTMATKAPMEPCLGRIQGACRVALVGVVCVSGLLQRQVATTEPASLQPRLQSARLLTSVN